MDDIENQAYQIPPSLRESDYFYGLTIPELGVVAGIVFLLCLTVISRKGITGLPWLAIPASLFFLLRRRDGGAGFVNPLHILTIMLRYYTGSQMFSLRRHLHLGNRKKEDSIE